MRQDRLGHIIWCVRVYTLDRERGKEAHAIAEQKCAEVFDFETLRNAIEQRNTEMMFSLYADDATFGRIDCNNTPSSPMKLRGKEEIAELGVEGAVAEDAALAKGLSTLTRRNLAAEPVV